MYHGIRLQVRREKGQKKNNNNNNKEEEKSFSFWLEVSAGSLCCHDYSR